MRLISLFVLLLLAACASQSPRDTSYLLRSGETLTFDTMAADRSAALGSVRVATYLEQPGLVLATGDGKIHAARYHRWAEPLQVSLRRFLAVEISAATGRDIAATAHAATATRINVMVDQLHGDGAGAAVLVAFWELITPAGSAASFHWSQTQPLAGDGYDELAAAERELLKRLAAAIADSLPP